MSLRLLALVLLWLPHFSWAQSACNVIVPMSQIHYVLERAVESPDQLDAQAMRRLSQITTALDDRYVVYHLSNHDIAEQTDLLIQMREAAHITAEAYLTQGPTRGLEIVRLDAIRTLVIRAGRILGPYPCQGNDPTRSTTGISSNGIDLSSTEDAPFPVRGALIVLALSVTLGGLCIFLIQRNLRRIADHNAREKRYHVAIATSLMVSSSNASTHHDTKIIDVSCNGAKLKKGDLPDFDEDTKVQIVLGPHTLDATIRWSNQHFIGIMFKTPLLTADVVRLKANYPPRRRGALAQAA